MIWCMFSCLFFLDVTLKDGGAVDIGHEGELNGLTWGVGRGRVGYCYTVAAFSSSIII